jgi:hypothetical protein
MQLFLKSYSSSGDIVDIVKVAGFDVHIAANKPTCNIAADSIMLSLDLFACIIYRFRRMSTSIDAIQKRG